MISETDKNLVRLGNDQVLTIDYSPLDIGGEIFSQAYLSQRLLSIDLSQVWANSNALNILLNTSARESTDHNQKETLPVSHYHDSFCSFSLNFPSKVTAIPTYCSLKKEKLFFLFYFQRLINPAFAVSSYCNLFN